jgi:hypothetical protein
MTKLRGRIADKRESRERTLRRARRIEVQQLVLRPVGSAERFAAI